MLPRAPLTTATPIDPLAGVRSHVLVDPAPPYNPYQPPEAIETPEIPDAPADPAPSDQATRGSRLAAAILDALILVVIALPLEFALGRFPHPSRTFEKFAVWTLFGFVCWVAIHGYSLKTRAQTLGKHLCNIQVVNVRDNLPASFVRLLVWRHLPMTLLFLLPYRVGLFLTVLDELFIFADDHRCLHDRIAGTRMVRLAPPAQS